MTERPEDSVIADIDALIDEQLNTGPVDDYRENYYPDCNRCSHDWHGEECQSCGCERSTGEVAKRPPRYYGRGHRIDYVDQVESVWISDDEGYTLADLETLRSRPWVVYHSQVSQDYPQRYVLGEQQRRPEIRFWARDARGDLSMLQGVAEVMRIDWSRHGVTVAVRLDDTTMDQHDEQPAGTIPDGMITMEGRGTDGFHPVGYLHPQDLEIETRTEAVHVFGGDTVRVTQEHCEVTMRINPSHFSPLFRRLSGVD